MNEETEAIDKARKRLERLFMKWLKEGRVIWVDSPKMMRSIDSIIQHAIVDTESKVCRVLSPNCHLER